MSNANFDQTCNQGNCKINDIMKFSDEESVRNNYFWITVR